MCGIFGYLGDRNVAEIVFSGLQHLEYRGYESCGIALRQKDGGFQYEKTAGEVSRLLALAGHFKDLDFVSGIGHTRWPTYGEASDRNAQPVRSSDKTLFSAHNGIIENRAELANMLEGEGYLLEAECDGQVIPVLLERELKEAAPGESFDLTFCRMLAGSFAFAVLSSKTDEIYVSRRNSPICVGVGENEQFIASDAVAFAKYTRKMIALNDDECAILSRDGIDLLTWTNDNGVLKCKRVSGLTRIQEIEEQEEADMAHYNHWMMKEIFEQPEAINRAIDTKIHRIGEIDVPIPPELLSVRFLACGTSYHAGLIGSYIMTNELNISSRCEYASEYAYHKCLLTPKNLVVGLSQSGETADTREALKTAKETGAYVIGIVNVLQSQIARLTGHGLLLHAGPELGVASTKAFTCQIAALNLLAARISVSDQYRYQVIASLVALQTEMDGLLRDQNFLKMCYDASFLFEKSTNAMYLGRRYNYPCALEGALKLKEISYIHAEGFPAGEMKHGPIALVDKHMPCVFICGGDDDKSKNKIIHNIEEIKSRHGIIICITDESCDEISKLSDVEIRVPKVPDRVCCAMKIIPLQLIAYHVAVHRGLNPDRPRNLAKCVTVE